MLQTSALDIVIAVTNEFNNLSQACHELILFLFISASVAPEANLLLLIMALVAFSNMPFWTNSTPRYL